MLLRLHRLLLWAAECINSLHQKSSLKISSELFLSAKELFVSQPALSSAVKNLEEELGYEIFNRKKSPVTLTAEGELYIEYLEESIEIERNLKERISSLHDLPFEKLSIGGSNSIAHHILPKICGEFCRRYPNVSLKIDVGGHLCDKLGQGNLDLVVQSICDFSRFDAVKLWEEKYVVAVRKDYPGAISLLILKTTHVRH